MQFKNKHMYQFKGNFNISFKKAFGKYVLDYEGDEDAFMEGVFRDIEDIERFGY